MGLNQINQVAQRPHEMQITLPDSKKFAEDRGEDMSTGS